MKLKCDKRRVVIPVIASSSLVAHPKIRENMKVFKLVASNGKTSPDADLFLFEFDMKDRQVYIFDYTQERPFIDVLRPAYMARYDVGHMILESQSSYSIKEFKEFLKENRLKFLILFGKSSSELLDPIVSKAMEDEALKYIFRGLM